MRTTSGLFPQLVSEDHLDRAVALTVRGKRRRPDVATLLFRREQVVAQLARSLAEGSWHPRRFSLLFIRDPKPRVIARAPVEDRVVHTALVELMKPTLLRSLRSEAMACREGLGTHRAVLRLAALMRRHRHAVHLDVRSYFPSIDPGRVLALLARRIRDRPFLEVVARVLDSSRGLYANPSVRRHAHLAPDWPPPQGGLPIGAYTSQVFAAWLYLDAFDHFVKRLLKVPGYLRYVDDLFLFGDSRAQLRAWREAIGHWLWTERGLRLKHPGARILSCQGHLDALGHRIHRDQVQPLPRTLRRLHGKVGAHARGARLRVDIERSVTSTAGLWMFGAELGSFPSDRGSSRRLRAATGSEGAGSGE